MREIRARDLRRAITCERERQIARSAAQIEHSRISPRESRREAPRDATTPNVVESPREQMVQQVVARRDPAEHLAHSPRSLLLVASALEARTGERTIRASARGNVAAARDGVTARGNAAAARDDVGASRATIEFVEADALHLPFADSTFDLVTTAFGFRNLANYDEGLKEIRRVLRPGGEIGILEFSEPRGKLFGALYRFYFRRILPTLGGMISGNSAAYSYLPRSVGRFPSPEELAAQMAATGFSDVRFARWTGGIVALHTARRA